MVTRTIMPDKIFNEQKFSVAIPAAFSCDRPLRREARNRAFTLVELLVVIAIIGIIASILFPAFGRVRERARATSCASNMKQLGLGFAQYIQDFDERYPVGIGGLGNGWAGELYIYTKSLAVYTCPSDTYIPGGGDTAISYGYNLAIPDDTVPGNPGQHTLLSRFNAPAKTVVLFEASVMAARPATQSNLGGQLADYAPGLQSGGLYATSGAGNGAFTVFQYQGGGGAAGYNTGYMGRRGYFGGANGSFDPARGSSGATGRHTERSNFLFADGHVKALNGDSVSTGHTNTKSTCDQDSWSDDGVTCDRNDVTPQAAGTGAPGWAATFSVE